MTVSDARRIENVNEALRILMSELADRALPDYTFMQADSPFAGVLRTTWDELQLRSWIRPTDSMLYVVTGAGWKTGLKLTGQLNDDFRAISFKLVGALKSKVAGRHDDAFVCIHDFETEGIRGGLSSTWSRVASLRKSTRRGAMSCDGQTAIRATLEHRSSESRAHLGSVG